ncbi:hypothetical protein DFLDMN_000750 [Cupriavidus sp. H19C3]|uniref:LysR family transcriptional regulator n=1 Tax=Cupriavidus sp. H19C3 TaxID=3241603 RepID=UPI003BF82BF5
MNFNLSDLRAFVAVAELSSFRAAAAELHLSQPALSRRIEKLEDVLGVRLFDRTTRSVEMTAVGREFSRKARELLNGLEESLLGIRDVATRITGEVTVACVPSAVRYFLPAVLRQYHARYPRIVVRLIDEGANEVLNMVVRNEADFGLNYIGTQEPDVEFEPVLKEPFVVACPPDHPLARKRKVAWAELGQYDASHAQERAAGRADGHAHGRADPPPRPLAVAGSAATVRNVAHRQQRHAGGGHPPGPQEKHGVIRPVRRIRLAGREIAAYIDCQTPSAGPFPTIRSHSGPPSASDGTAVATYDCDEPCCLSP